jgi:hypothetical protein
MGALARITRRRLLQDGAVGLGALSGLALIDPVAVLAKKKTGVPRPIPGGFDQNFQIVPKDPFVHVLPPGIGFEMSTITDFKGVVGASETRGTARGSDGSRWEFDADMRFMRGEFVGMDGRRDHGAFGFI